MNKIKLISFIIKTILIVKLATPHVKKVDAQEWQQYNGCHFIPEIGQLCRNIYHSQNEKGQCRYARQLSSVPEVICTDKTIYINDPNDPLAKLYIYTVRVDSNKGLVLIFEPDVPNPTSYKLDINARCNITEESMIDDKSQKYVLEYCSEDYRLAILGSKINAGLDFTLTFRF